MKKTLTLAALFLLPLLVSAYELEPKDAEFAKELNGVFTTNLQEAALEYEADSEPETPVEKIKSIILKSRQQFADWHTCLGEVVPPTYPMGFIRRYFNTDRIKNELTKQDLYTVLQTDEQVLNEVAQYIVDRRPHRNDFETLLAIGVKPVEAAVMVENEDYIKSAIEKGIITYAHYFIDNKSDEYCTQEVATIKPVTIEATTTKEEIEALKEKHPHRLTGWEYLNSLEYLQAVGEGFQNIQNAGKY